MLPRLLSLKGGGSRAQTIYPPPQGMWLGWVAASQASVTVCPLSSSSFLVIGGNPALSQCVRGRLCPATSVMGYVLGFGHAADLGNRLYSRVRTQGVQCAAGVGHRMCGGPRSQSAADFGHLVCRGPCLHVVPPNIVHNPSPVFLHFPFHSHLTVNVFLSHLEVVSSVYLSAAPDEFFDILSPPAIDAARNAQNAMAAVPPAAVPPAGPPDPLANAAFDAGNLAPRICSRITEHLPTLSGVLSPLSIVLWCHSNCNEVGLHSFSSYLVIWAPTDVCWWWHGTCCPIKGMCNVPHMLH